MDQSFKGENINNIGQSDSLGKKIKEKLQSNYKETAGGKGNQEEKKSKFFKKKEEERARNEMMR